MSISIIFVIVLLLIGVIAVIALYTKLKQQKEIAEAYKQDAINKSAASAAHEREVERQKEQGIITEEIRHEQIEKRDKINTGNIDNDFNNSIDILSDIATKRADGRNRIPGQANTGN
jgi:predicted Holliday junction resolvase-like endonuclease